MTASALGWEFFCDAKEQATAHSVASRDEFDYPLFNAVLGDIDHFIPVNRRFMNMCDILSEFDLKATSTTDTIAKINRLSKLVTRGGVTLKDLFMAKSLMDNIGEHGTLWVPQTMSPSGDNIEITRYVEFKAAHR